MSESLDIEKELVPPDQLPKESQYGEGEFTPVHQEEINHLEKLQTLGAIGDEKWSGERFERLQFLRDLKNGKKDGLTKEQKARLAELRKLQMSKSTEMAPEEMEEIRRLGSLE